jgi:HK97 gp10 family phage protein
MIRIVKKDYSKQIIERINNSVKQDMEIVANEMAMEAKQGAPVKTGQLRDSITVTGADGNYTVGSNVPYAKYIEFGTPKTAAVPFLSRAVEIVKSRINTLFRKL